MISLFFFPAGDVLLTSAYLSYVGCFNRQYRVQLLEEKWRPFMKTLDVSNKYCISGNFGNEFEDLVIVYIATVLYY